MADPYAYPCVLVVADRDRIGELVAALSELRNVEVLVSSGGDDTIELFEARLPAVVVVTASLQQGDAKSLIIRLRGMMPKAEVAVVIVGDDAGPIRTALDALDLAPDRFVTRPLSPKALRFAVTGGIDAVRIVRGGGAVPRPSRPLAVSSEVRLMPVTRDVPEPATPMTVHEAPTAQTRAALRARWEALADSMTDGSDDFAPPAAADAFEDPAPPPILIKPRRHMLDPVPRGTATPVDGRGIDPAGGAAEWQRGVGEPLPLPVADERPEGAVPVGSRTVSANGEPVVGSRTVSANGELVVAARTSSDEVWSEPMPIAELVESETQADRDSESTLERTSPRRVTLERLSAAEIGGADAFGDERDDDDELDEVTSERLGELLDGRGRAPADDFDEEVVLDRELFDRHLGVAMRHAPSTRPPPLSAVAESRDFARELRAKMSMMAQRLFHDGDGAGVADHALRHDHSTEIDLSSLGDDMPLTSGLTELEPPDRQEIRGPQSPSSWDSQVRDRGLADSGALVRGTSDAAMLLAKMFAQSTTGRISFRRDDVESVVYFDRGRPVFASSNEPRDRMGLLLLREGKITAAQYERCQTVVAESGRRMGEILVGFGYLKRRELLPAVRRHVEDIIYSLFSWDRGSYRIALDPHPSSERIRLSRHPAALILEGIRRKLDRSSLERLVGPPSTVIEVPDRDRLGGIVNTGDLTPEERAALAAFDGQTDLIHVAQLAAIDVADVLPLAWGLCVLGLATARRADSELSDEATALVGETDLAIDRERVRARWQLVTDADYFALLGVRRDATGFEIRRAYQSARRDFAADCFPGDLRRELARELEDIAQVLDEAFRVLRDDRLRQTYLANLVDR